MNKIHSYPPILVALSIQALAYFVLTLILPQMQPLLGYAVPLFWVMLAQGTIAALVTYFLRFSYWWVIIQLAGPPLLIIGIALNLPVWVYPVLVILLLAVFWNVAINRVPLYLTNTVTSDSLAGLLPKKEGLRFADLGSGLGGTLRVLARLRPKQHFFGYETAPLPFCASWLLGKLTGSRNSHIYFKSFWSVDLEEYDVVYCFLSPVPMKDIFEKASREMKPGSLFISNSFTVPGKKPDRTVTVKDGRKTKLMIWKL